MAAARLALLRLSCSSAVAPNNRSLSAGYLAGLSLV